MCVTVVIYIIYMIKSKITNLNKDKGFLNYDIILLE